MSLEYIQEVELEKFNPYHDSLGRFTTASGAKSFTIRTRGGAYQQSMVDRAIEREKQRTGSAQKAIDECKTTKEVEKIIQDRNYFYKTTLSDGREHDTNKMISLGKIDVEVAKGLAKECDSFFEKFPELKGELIAFTIDKVSKNNRVGECVLSSGRGGVTLSDSFFGLSAQTLDERWKRGTKKTEIKDEDNPMIAIYKIPNFNPLETNAYSVLSHELAHAMDDYLTNTLNITKRGKNGANYVSNKLRPKVLRACGKKKSEIADEVSGYATKNAHEWFAECIAEFVNSPNPRPMAMEVGKRAIELLKGGTL